MPPSALRRLIPRNVVRGRLFLHRRRRREVSVRVVSVLRFPSEFLVASVLLISNVEFVVTSDRRSFYRRREFVGLVD